MVGDERDEQLIRRRGASVASVLVACLGVSAISAAPALAVDAPCLYDQDTKTVSYAMPTSYGLIPLIQRAGNGSEIYIGTEGGEGEADLCTDPDGGVHATVNNTDTINLSGNTPGSGYSPRLEFGFHNGRLEPGATPEADGSEIEINAPDVTGGFLVRAGRTNGEGTSPLNDNFRAGTEGINFNANETTKDVDLIIGASAGGALAGVTFAGGQGRDALSNAGGGVLGGSAASYTGLYGQSGNDTVTLAGSSTSTVVDGGPGNDTLTGNGLRGFSATSLQHSGATGPITVDLSDTGPQAVGGGLGTDTLSGLYNVSGTAFGDTLTGDAGTNWIGGGTAGDDTIHGGDAGDSLSGGPGDDTLFGDAGIDTLNGYEDDDELHGGADGDTLDGDVSSIGADRMFGDSGDDRIQLDSGDDVIDGGTGVDEVNAYGATGPLDLDLAPADPLTITTSGLGEDELSGIEAAAGTEFADRLRGDQGANRLTAGNGGADILLGRSGNDQLSASGYLDDQPKTVDGGPGNDYVSGDGGPDDLRGGLGADTVVGLAGDDRLSGPGDGSVDGLYCGDGDDSITAYDAGQDTLYTCEHLPPSIAVADAISRPEGGTALSYAVTLSSASTSVVKVNYATQDGTAHAPGDYTAKSGTLTFSAGQTSKVVLVSTVEDAVVEPTETVRLNLSGPENATIGDGAAVGRILDDD